MKCPQCGYQPALGRPRKVDDKVILKMSRKGMSLGQIAKELKVTRGAIQAALKRSRS